MIQNTQNIAVVIPTYNRESTIESCIKSVSNQTTKVNEIIVVDDCSTDNTTDIVKSFNNINLLKTKSNSGAQAARNIGIKSANSEWIAFIDSDDEWLPDKLEKQLDIIKLENFNPFTVVHGDCIVRNINTGKEKVWHLEKIDGDNVYNQLLSKSGTFFPSIITSKLALEKIGFLDENVPSYQEWDTSIRLSKFCTFKHIQDPLFIYNIQNDSMSNNLETNLKGYHYVVSKFENEIKTAGGHQLLNKHIINSATMAMNSNKFSYGRKLLDKINEKSFKKNILVLLSYLRIKPKYLYQSINYLTWKKQ